MPALPYKQRPESQCSEKRSYRLSLSDSAKNHKRGNTFPGDGSSVDKNANTWEERRDIFFQDGNQCSSPCGGYFGEAAHSRSYGHTPSSTPTPQRHYKHPLESGRGLPRWISALGLWLPNEQKSSFYQSFSRHLTPLDRSKANMLDPFPHLSRCGHAGTLSSLERQRDRLKIEEEYRNQERFIRLLERFSKITQEWKKFQRQLSEAAGTEHQTRLEAFKKSKDHYVDPKGFIKQNREEKERVEKERQKVREKKRERRRKIIPQIIITDYDEELREKMAREFSEASESVTRNDVSGEPHMDSNFDVNEKSMDGQFEYKDMVSSSPIPAPSELDKPVDMEQSLEAENEKVEIPKEAPFLEDTNVDYSSFNCLKPPALSALDIEHEMPIKKSELSVDDTVGLMTGKAPVPFGLSNGLIPDPAIKTSSVQDRYHAGSQARLNNTKHGRNAGAWCPKKSNEKQYLEVDLGSEATVMQVATQGYPGKDNITTKDMRWVKNYSLSYSMDGKHWNDYTEGGSSKVFRGNQDNNTVVLNSLGNPVEARFIRFLPKSWRNCIAMRVEVYGNYIDECITPSEPEYYSPEAPTLDTKEPSPIPNPAPSPLPLVTKPLSPVMEGIDQKVEGQVVQLFSCSSMSTITPLEVWEEETVESVIDMVPEEPCIETELSPSGPGVHGEKQSSKLKRKPKKPKPEKKEKKKKSKKKKFKLPLLPGVIEEPDSEEVLIRSPTPEEEPEDKYRIPTPPLPEIPKQPVSVVRIPQRTRRNSMFQPKGKSPDEAENRKLSRAQANDSINKELLRQQVAEERRQKLESLGGKKKRGQQGQGLSPEFSNFDLDSDSFMYKYCILDEGQSNYYRRIFENFDEDGDEFLFPEEFLEALECVNKKLLADSHLQYIFRVLELCDCSPESGADFKFFSVVAAFSQRIAALDEFAKILISKLDFKELDYKLQRAKSLFKCFANENTLTMSMEHLTLELTVGDLGRAEKNQVLRSLGQTTYLDFLDFLTYIPLFIHIHEHVLAHPLGRVTSVM